MDTWGERLRRDYFGMHRFDDPDGVVEFNLPLGEWIALFRANGFQVDRLIELRPAEDAPSTYRTPAETRWAHRWPMEQLWVLRKEA